MCIHPLDNPISNFILCAFYETKRLFSLVIETVERKEESPVISDLVFPWNCSIFAELLLLSRPEEKVITRMNHNRSDSYSFSEWLINYMNLKIPSREHPFMTPAPPIRELQGCRNRGQKGQLPPPTVCSNGFYADIWSQRQMQQYKLCLKSFLSNFGSSEVT